MSGPRAIPSLRLSAQGFRVEKRRPGYPYQRRSVTMASRTTSGGDYNLSDPVNSFVDVVRHVVLQPVVFFAHLPRQLTLVVPLVFALISVEIFTVLVGLLTFI